MEYFVTKADNKIIFKDLEKSLELEINHHEEDCIFDTIFIDKKYDLDFIEYIVKELKQSNDLGVIFVEYDSQEVEKLLNDNGLKISNYQYSLKSSKYSLSTKYTISSDLNDEAKEFYLKLINKHAKNNFSYCHPNEEYQIYREKWFNIEGFEYRIYKKDEQIVGIVDFKNFEDNPNYRNATKEYFNYNNKLCIRCLLSEDKQVLEDIVYDLLNYYKKDIIINITYSENDLKDIVDKLNGTFDFCQYIYVNEKKTNE